VTRAWPLLALLVGLPGCVTVEGTLRADGSGALEMTYQTPPDATEFWERRQYSSPVVHVDSVKIYESQKTVLRATVDDVTRLNTARGFGFVDIRRARDGDDERLEIRLLNPGPKPVPDDPAPWMRIGLTLPGAVRSANHDAVVSGAHVAWTVTRSEYARQAATVLTVRWR
jgi:hypothetical protein